MAIPLETTPLEEVNTPHSPKTVSSPLAPMNELCPRCLGNLTAAIGFDGWIGLAPPQFICEECGYRGNAHFEPDKRIEGFTQRAREFVYANELPWEANPNRMGQPSKNHPRALVICLLLKAQLGESNRGLVLFLSGNKYLWPAIGLKKLPGRMDLQRAMSRLSDEYLMKMNSFVISDGVAHKGQIAAILPHA
jgi:hypothetical protein